MTIFLLFEIWLLIVRINDYSNVDYLFIDYLEF